MPQSIDRDRVQKLVGEGAQLIEVLLQSAYQQGHLPGAINIPLTALRRATVEGLDKEKPTIVYCYDFL